MRLSLGYELVILLSVIPTALATYSMVVLLEDVNIWELISSVIGSVEF